MIIENDHPLAHFTYFFFLNQFPTHFSIPTRGAGWFTTQEKGKVDDEEKWEKGLRWAGLRYIRKGKNFERDPKVRNYNYLQIC